MPFGNSKGLTGSSSLCVQTPLHCLCSITCLMFISTGKAIQPDAKLQRNRQSRSSQHDDDIKIALFIFHLELKKNVLIDCFNFNLNFCKNVKILKEILKDEV